MATLRRDGFTSLEVAPTASRSDGVAITKPLIFTGSHLFVNFGVSGGDDGSRQNNDKTGDGTDKTKLYRKSAFVQLTGCSAVYFPASIKSSPCQNLRDLPRLYLGSADSIPCLIEYTHLDVKGL